MLKCVIVIPHESRMMKRKALLAADAYLQRACRLHCTPPRPLLHTHCKIFSTPPPPILHRISTEESACEPNETALLSLEAGYTKSTHHAGDRRLVFRSMLRPMNPLSDASSAKTGSCYLAVCATSIHHRPNFPVFTRVCGSTKPHSASRARPWNGSEWRCAVPSLASTIN